MKKLIFLLAALGLLFMGCEGDVQHNDDDDDNDNDSEDASKKDDDDNDDVADDDDKQPADDDDDNDDTSGDDDGGNTGPKVCFLGDYPEGPYGFAVNQTISNLEFDNCDGSRGKIDLKQHAGKKLLWLVVGAGWCSACFKELLLLDDFYKAHGDKVEIMYIMGEGNTQGNGKISMEFCEDYAKGKKLPFPIVRDEGYKQTGKYFSFAGGTPLNIMIDKCMKIRLKEEGWGDHSYPEYEMYMEMLMEEEEW